MLGRGGARELQRAVTVLGIQPHAGNAAVSGLLGALGSEHSCSCGGRCDDCKGEHQGRRGQLESNAEPTTPRTPPPTVSAGSRSPVVLRLQRLLVATGATIDVDGIFGPQTAGAVKGFQRSAGLAADGIAGPKTWGALERAAGSGGGKPAADYEAVLAKFRNASELVKRMKSGEAQRPQPQAVEARPAPSETAGIAFLDDELEAAEQALSELAGGVTETASEAASWVGEQAEAAAEWAGETAEAAAAWAEETAQDVGTWAEETVSDVGAWAEETASDAGRWVEEEVAAPAQDVVRRVGEAVDELGNELAGVGESLKSRFREELEALEKAISELGKGLGADWDAVGHWLDEFINGAAAANVAKAGDPAGQTEGLPPGCQISVSARPLGRDECPVPTKEPDVLDELLGRTGRLAGAIFTYEYPELNMGGTCPISLDGATLTETVTSDGGVTGKSDVRIGTCPINPDGKIPGCKDTYGICLPMHVLAKNMRGRTKAVETFTQQLFVQGILVETHKIKFVFWREGPFVSVVDIVRE